MAPLALNAPIINLPKPLIALFPSPIQSLENVNTIFHLSEGVKCTYWNVLHVVWVNHPICIIVTTLMTAPRTSKLSRRLGIFPHRMRYLLSFPTALANVFEFVALTHEAFITKVSSRHYSLICAAHPTFP